MKLITPLHQLSELKSSDVASLECCRCNKVFTKTVKRVREVLRGYKDATAEFCSNSCKSAAQNRGLQCTCATCGESITRTEREKKTVKNSFCSKSCAATFNNSRKTKGTRRSKLEAWIESQLQLRCPKLRVEYNKKSAINSELDIYFPDLRLAFELNGIFHYEPIYGPEKLAKIVNNDSRKFQACAERKIALCVIDTSGLKYFKPDKAEKYLNIILEIVARTAGEEPASFGLEPKAHT